MPKPERYVSDDRIRVLRRIVHEATEAYAVWFAADQMDLDETTRARLGERVYAVLRNQLTPEGALGAIVMLLEPDGRQRAAELLRSVEVS